MSTLNGDGPEIVRAALVQTKWTGDKASMIEANEALAREAAPPGRPGAVLPGDLQRPLLLPGPGPRVLSYAEPIPGPTTELMATWRARPMVIVVPIYEDEQAGVYYNTAAVIDADGTYLGKYRKHHIPHVGGLLGEVLLQARRLRLPGLRDALSPRSASTSATTGTSPRAARCLGLNGARDRLQPVGAPVAGLSATCGSSSSPRTRWPTSYFMGAINRVGIEAPRNIGRFYGSSLLRRPARPDRGRGRPRTEDELVVRDLDLEPDRRGAHARGSSTATAGPRAYEPGARPQPATRGGSHEDADQGGTVVTAERPASPPTCSSRARHRGAWPRRARRPRDWREGAERVIDATGQLRHPRRHRRATRTWRCPSGGTSRPTLRDRHRARPPSAARRPSSTSPSSARAERCARRSTRGTPRPRASASIDYGFHMIIVGRRTRRR